MKYFRRQFKNHFVWWGIGIQVKKRGDCFMHRARSFLGSLAATNVWFLCHLGQSGWWISHEETAVLYSMTITIGPNILWNRHMCKVEVFQSLPCLGWRLWHYRLWSFKSRDTKLERFLPKNQHTQRKLIEFWELD